MARCAISNVLRAKGLVGVRGYSPRPMLEGSELKHVELINRALIRVCGPDALGFLQGLVTNDTRYLEKRDCQQKSMFALMLNNQGRVVHDLIIYNCTSEKSRETELMIDCDRSTYGDLAETFLKYRLRKKVDFHGCRDTLSVFAVFPDAGSRDLLDGSIDSNLLIPARLADAQWHSHAVGWAIDPRLSRLGARLILPFGESCDPYLMETKKVTLEEYHATRYMLGISEGASDIIPGKSLPLESNGDYMNGISFHKGCYIGQELTARTHHTGVVRKRLMPLKFQRSQEKLLPGVKFDSKIYSESGELVGRFRSLSGLFGLGLLKMDEAMKSKNLEIEAEDAKEKIRLETYFPFWWGNSDLRGEIRGFRMI